MAIIVFFPPSTGLRRIFELKFSCRFVSKDIVTQLVEDKILLVSTNLFILTCNRPVSKRIPLYIKKPNRMNDIRDFFLINRNKIRDVPFLFSHRQCILPQGSSIQPGKSVKKRSDTVDVLHGSLDQQQILVKFGHRFSHEKRSRSLFIRSNDRQIVLAGRKRGKDKEDNYLQYSSPFHT